jgi:NAD(P)-dependent dehydrogenase (short-subunit alcohol dehydrogenase family)
MVFISSLSGWIGHPGVSAYADSKFALHILQNFVLTMALSSGNVESLWKETAHLGIKTLLIEPGRF